MRNTNIIIINGVDYTVSLENREKEVKISYVSPCRYEGAWLSKSSKSTYMRNRRDLFILEDDAICIALNYGYRSKPRIESDMKVQPVRIGLAYLTGVAIILSLPINVAHHYHFVNKNLLEKDAPIKQRVISFLLPEVPLAAYSAGSSIVDVIKHEQSLSK